jgi:hypothetical protein
MSHTCWTILSDVPHNTYTMYLKPVRSLRTIDVSAAAGVLGIGLLFVTLFLPGPPPKSDDTTAHLVQVLMDRRGILLVGTWIGGLGGAAFLWFLGPLHRFLHAGDGDREATAATAGGVAAVMLLWCGISMSAALALSDAGSGDSALVRAATDLGNMLIELSKFGLAVLIVAATVAARRAVSLPRAATDAGLVAAAFLVLTALPPFFADHGFWQFGGPAEIGGGIPAAAWVMWLSGHLALRGRESISPADRGTP